MTSLYESHKATESTTTSDSDDFERDSDNEAYILFTDLTRYNGQKVGNSDLVRTKESDNSNETADRDKSPLLREYDLMMDLKKKYSSKVHKNDDTPNQKDYRSAIGEGGLDTEIITEVMNAEFPDADLEVTGFEEATDHETKEGNDPVYLPVFGDDGSYTAPPELEEEARDEKLVEEIEEETEPEEEEEPSAQRRAAEMKVEERPISNKKIAERLDVSTTTVTKGCKRYLKADLYEELKAECKGNSNDDNTDSETTTETQQEAHADDLTVSQRADKALEMIEAGFSPDQITAILGN